MKIIVAPQKINFSEIYYLYLVEKFSLLFENNLYNFGFFFKDRKNKFLNFLFLKMILINFFFKIIFSVFQISIFIPIHINITLKQVFCQNIWNKLINFQHTSYKLKANQAKYKI